MNKYFVCKDFNVSMEDYGFQATQLLNWVKKRDSFLCLLVDCFKMILWAATTMGRSYNFCFVHHLSMFCHWNVSNVFKFFAHSVPCCWIQICCLEICNSRMFCCANTTFQYIQNLSWTNHALFYFVSLC